MEIYPQRALNRIRKEITDLEKSRGLLKENGIHFYYDLADITKMEFMIIGPDDTPYQDGFYLFELVYPTDYPLIPPVVKYCTQGYVRNIGNHLTSMRFNPNLYTCGKVCLSLLNTWQGPGWTPVNTVINVFMSILGMVLNESPLKNEPGYEDLEEVDKYKYRDYNDIVRFAKYKIAICDILELTPPNFLVFKRIMIEHFLKNFDRYISECIEIKNSLRCVNVTMPCYGDCMILDYDNVIVNMANLRNLFNLLWNNKKYDDDDQEEEQKDD